jgi:hypothetical protein
LWQPDGLENSRPPGHIGGMASGIWTTEYFDCPNCGLAYIATKEAHPDQHSGSFNCQVCDIEVHAWSGPYDFFGWKVDKADSPVFGKKK